jgi:hypothetical protein
MTVRAVMHLYTPWWLDNKKLDFPRGYHIEPSGGHGCRAPASGRHSQLHADRRASHPKAFGGYGKG